MDAARARRALLELSQPALVALELSGPLAKLALTGSARTPGDGFVSDLRGSVEPEAHFENDELAASALVALHNVDVQTAPAQGVVGAHACPIFA